VHCVRAVGNLLEILREEAGTTADGLPTVVLHSFAGPDNFVRPLADLGCYFAFSGTVFGDPPKPSAPSSLSGAPSAIRLPNLPAEAAAPPGPVESLAMCDAIRAVPLERLLVETDAPTFSPSYALVGCRSEPASVRAVAQRLWTVRRQPQTTANPDMGENITFEDFSRQLWHNAEQAYQQIWHV